MNGAPLRRSNRHMILATVALAFGLVTIVAGGRVLFGGADPGYVVFRPLLIFNSVMGAAYVAAGIAIWRGLRWTRYATGTLAALHLLALGALLFVFSSGRAVAVDSLRAMAFRSAVSLVLWIALVRERAQRPLRTHFIDGGAPGDPPGR